MLTPALLSGETIENAFILAMLLTGSIHEAETCVAECADCDFLPSPCAQRIFHRVLMRATDADSDPFVNLLQWDSCFAILPWQLGCILCLPLPQRRCFVLRILAGLSREVCAWLLNMDSYDVCQNTQAALNRMATLHETLGIVRPDQSADKIT